MTILLPTPAAHAGHWVFTCGAASNGNYTIVSFGVPYQVPWTLPAAQNYLFSIGRFGSSTDYATSLAVTISVNVVATWKTSDGLPLSTTTDPPPPSVWLCESAQSEWKVGTSGTADDGFGDPCVPNLFPPEGGSSFTDPGTTHPPAYWTKCTVNSGVATLPTRTLKAEADDSGSGYGYSGGSCEAYVDSYQVTVHATPYNFQKVVGGGHILPDGTLIFTYDWLSTTGNKNDLTTCFWHEYVTYPGVVGTIANPNKYYPPNPPFNFVTGVSWLNNPFVNPGVGKNGGPMTGTYQVTDTQNVPTLVDKSLYTYGAFTATQVYQYDDTATGDANLQIPGPDSGPFSIVRVLSYYDPNNFQYSCTKDGHTASALEPSH